MGKLTTGTGKPNKKRGKKFQNRPSLKFKNKMKPAGPKKTKKVDDLTSIKQKNPATNTKVSTTSYAGKYSKCSNPAFTEFLNHFQQSSSIQSEMLAILSAVVEVIKKNKGTQTSGEYYSALMTTLEQAETDQSVLATLSLLEMLLTTVPKEILQNQFTKVIQIFYEILKKYSTTDDYLIIRHCIECLSILLQAQEDKTWTDDLTIKICDEILSFAFHTKPKIRKKAQHAICMFLNNYEANKSDGVTIYHPAASQIANNCLVILKNPNTPMSNTKTLHLLSFLKEIIHRLPEDIVKLISNELQIIMERKDAMLTSCCLQTLDKIKTTEVTPPNFGVKFINCLYDSQPESEDSGAILAWLAALQQAQCNLTIDESSVNLVITFKKIMELWRSNDEKIVEASSKSVVVLVEKCLGPMCVDGATTKKYREILRDVIQSAQGGMKSKHVSHSVRKHTLIFIKALFEVAGGTCAKEMSAYLPRLVELHAEDKSVYKSLVESTIGSAVKSLGPEIILSKIPLQTLTSDIDHQVIWLLDVLKISIEQASLSFFRDNILPLAIMCDKKSTKLEQKNDETGAEKYKSLYYKIWNLLPAFCNNPKDVKSNFKSIAKILGVALQDREDLRMIVINSLKNLITTSVEKNKKKAIEELAKYSNNFLPSLFNLYATKSTDEQQQHQIFDVIKIYLSITSKKIVGDILSDVMKKFDESKSGDSINEALFDLIKLLINFVDKNKFDELYGMCVSMISDNENAKNQDKGYKILEEIITSESDICREFYKNNRVKIQKMFIKATENLLNESRENRLYCLRHLIKNHPKLMGTKFFQSIIPEIVMYTNEVEKKCQTISYELLNEIADKFLSDKEHGYFGDYIDMLIAGLNCDQSDQSYTASSLLALAGIALEYHESIDDLKLKEIIQYSSNLITGSSREIATAGLSFFKVVVMLLSAETLRPKLEIIMKGLTGMNNDCKRHCRKIILEIITKLIKKFNFKTIAHLVPESDEMTQSRLRNIQNNGLNKFANKEKEALTNGNASLLKGTKRKNGFDCDEEGGTGKSNFKPLKRSALNKKKKLKNARSLRQNQTL